jgi:hypothetical protein
MKFCSQKKSMRPIYISVPTDDQLKQQFSVSVEFNRHVHAGVNALICIRQSNGGNEKKKRNKQKGHANGAGEIM